MTEVTETDPCWTMATLDRRQSASAVPTEPSQTVALPLVTARKNVAVPLAAASVSSVTACAVATPATADANAGDPKVGLASNVCVVIAVSAVAGRGAV